MKKVITGLMVVLVVLIIYSLLFNPSENPPGTYTPSDTSEVELAPDFTLSDLESNEVTLSQFRGEKNVYIIFWATWCGYCRQEMPDIEEIYREYQDKDLVVLTVNVGENPDTVRNFIETNGFSFPVLLDTEQQVLKQYRVTSIPVSYFIDKEGKIRAQIVGLLNKSQMLSYIKGL